MLSSWLIRFAALATLVSRSASLAAALSASPPAATVHVVVAGDKTHSLGLIACARSVFQTAAHPDRMVVHLIVAVDNLADLRAAVVCALGPPKSSGGKYRYHLVPFDESSELARHVVALISVRHKQKQYLASAYNYARFYLDRLLPRNVRKVVWLDSDAIVLSDVAELFDGSLAEDGGNVIAAVPRDEKVICGSFLNCSNPEAMALLAQRKVTFGDLNAFNAGVVVIHLERWRSAELGKLVEAWLLANTQTPIFALGTNPPFVLATAGKFERIDAGWNCQVGSGAPCLAGLAARRAAEPAQLKPDRRRAKAKPRRRLDSPAGDGAVEAAPDAALAAKILHWSGDRKPWWPDASSLAHTVSLRGEWMRAFGSQNKACVLSKLPRSHVPNATLLLPATLPLKMLEREIAKRRAVFSGTLLMKQSVSTKQLYARIVAPLTRAHGAGGRGAALLHLAVLLSAVRFGDAPTVVILLRGRIYLDRGDSRPIGREKGKALLALHRAAQLEHPRRKHNFADASVFEIADGERPRQPGAVGLDAAFAPVAVPAIDCDAYECAATLASEVLRHYLVYAGQNFLSEHDVLQAIALANVDAAPLVFDRDMYKHADHQHTSARMRAIDRDGVKRRIKLSSRGFFSDKQSVVVNIGD